MVDILLSFSEALFHGNVCFKMVAVKRYLLMFSVTNIGRLQNQ